MKRAGSIGIGMVWTLLLLSAPARADAPDHDFRRAQDHDKGDWHHAQKLPQKIKSPKPPVVIKMQHRDIPRPDRIKNPAHVVRDHATVVVPERDWHGDRIEKQVAVTAPMHHDAIVRDTVLLGNIKRERRAESAANHYYWHEVNGTRYCHYYDHGIHWYGFYHGPTFYWTRYHEGRWWWFDASFDHWSYWWNGYWWWPSPSGALYVYVDNSYYPYEESGVTVLKPEIQSPPQTAPSTDGGTSWNSPDGRRRVKVTDAGAEAFLYDVSNGQPIFLKYLGRGADKVRFSGGEDGKPGQILLDLKDGSFAVFTLDGDPLESASDPALPPVPDVPPSGAAPSSGQ